MNDAAWEAWGYPTAAPCSVCARPDACRSEPRFGYSRCREHAPLPPDFPPFDRERRIGSSQTVDIATGKVVGTGPGFVVQPPRPGTCRTCGTHHHPDLPHNQQSLAYQYRFHADFGRWPTWSDAMSHCPDAIRAEWRAQLRAQLAEHGLPIPPDLDPEHDAR